MMRLGHKIDKLRIWRGDQIGGHTPLNLCELNLQLIALPLQQHRWLVDEHNLVAYCSYNMLEQMQKYSYSVNNQKWW